MTRAEDIISDALKRSGKERGLRITTPNDNLSGGHMEKADHNLVVMTDLNNLGHNDWVVITAYYAMYHSVLSLLAKVGLESKEHASTVAVLEYFFGKEITKELIEKFNDIKDRTEHVFIEEKYINYLWKVKRARETVQYGIDLTYKETGTIINIAREFVGKIKLVINGIDQGLIEIINVKVKEMGAGKLHKIG